MGHSILMEKPEPNLAVALSTDFRISRLASGPGLLWTAKVEFLPPILAWLPDLEKRETLGRQEHEIKSLIVQALSNR